MKKFSIFKLFFYITILLLIFTGCIRNTSEKPLPPQESSIFEKGNVEKVQVIIDSAYIRSGNSETYPVVSTVKKDRNLDVAGLVGKWYIIVLDDGRVGAINPDEVKPLVEKPSLEGQQIKAKGLNPNEQEMLRLVNGERTKRGIQPLKVDLEVTDVARNKSQDIIDNSYFSHYSPTYGSPFNMLKTFGVKYIYAGENLAGNSSVDEAHKALMNSKGHKENILNPNFTHIGIGVKEGAQYGKIFTQLFIGR